MAKHITIVDDEVDLVETVKLRLEGNGFQVSTTMGDQAVKDISGFKPDLILLDVIMPGMDGIAILKELKRDANLSKIPVILFTAKPKASLIEFLGPEWASGYVSKPYDPKEMLDQIQKVLGP
ncbi:MAG: response regulator [Candidatus Omnitrophica bacterium]|nr:response regulator [Candidatus Omnitrophota bacterium]